LESTSKSIEEIEVDKYLNQDYKDFRKNILATANSLRLPTIQQVEDSGTKDRLFIPKILSKKHSSLFLKRRLYKADHFIYR
jgi:two-component system phosphate regulon sensor histidine kinase PhoR